MKMKESDIELLRDVGESLLRRQHERFVARILDNSEHVEVVRMIAEACGQYAEAHGADPSSGSMLKRALLGYARELFVAEWMRTQDEDEGVLEAADADKARETFDSFL